MRTKLLLTFIIIVAALLAIGYFGQTTIHALINNLQVESKPNLRLESIREILSDLIEAESSVRTYTITKDADDLAVYYRKVAQFDPKMDRLYGLSRDSLKMAEVEEIGALIDQKLEILNDLINLNDDDRINQVLQRVLNELDEIEEVENESRSPNVNIQPKSNLPAENPGPTVTIDTATNEKTRFGFFKRLFGTGKKKSREAESPEILTEAGEGILKDQNAKLDGGGGDPRAARDSTEMPEDSTFSYGAQNDTLLPLSADGYKVIISRIEDEEERVSRALAARSLKLIQKDKEIMDRIRSKIAVMEDVEEEESLMRSENSGLIAKKTQRVVLFIMVSAIFIFLMLLGIIFLDFSKIKKSRMQLEEARITSDKLAKTKEEFLSNMSHEIRTPLSAIVGFAEQLMDSDLNRQQGDHLKKILSSSQHLMLLVNDILDLSKMEKGMLILESGVFYPAREIGSLLEMLELQAKNKGLSLEARIESLKGVVVKGDPFRFRQILINLLSNAIKFTDKGGVLLAATAKEEQEGVHLHIEVKDTGIGIPADKREQIFEYFTQADPTDTRNYGGTGLGLTIAKNLVELHGGKLTLDSEQGKGSVFSFGIFFKRGQEEELIKERSPTVFENRSLAGRKILVAEDQVYNLELIRTILEKWACRVTVVTDGLEAFHQLKAGTFDAALLDIQMPGMSGLELIHAMHKEMIAKPGIPFIAVTARTDKALIRRLKNAGFDSILTKPYKMEELHHALVSGLQLNKDDGATEMPGQVDTNQRSAAYQLDELIEMADGNNDFIIKMLELFINETDSVLDEIAEGIMKQNGPGIAAICHRSIPSCRHMKLYDMVERFRTMEEAGKDGDLEQAANILSNTTEEWVTTKKALQMEVAKRVGNSGA